MKNENTFQAIAGALVLTRFPTTGVYQLALREATTRATGYVRPGKQICITPAIIARQGGARNFADMLQAVADEIRSGIMDTRNPDDNDQEP